MMVEKIAVAKDKVKFWCGCEAVKFKGTICFVKKCERANERPNHVYWLAIGYREEAAKLKAKEKVV